MRITLPNGKWRKRLKIKALPPFAELHKVRAGNCKMFILIPYILQICVRHGINLDVITGIPQLYEFIWGDRNAEFSLTPYNPTPRNRVREWERFQKEITEISIQYLNPLTNSISLPEISDKISSASEEKEVVSEFFLFTKDNKTYSFVHDSIPQYFVARRLYKAIVSIKIPDDFKNLISEINNVLINNFVLSDGITSFIEYFIKRYHFVDYNLLIDFCKAFLHKEFDVHYILQSDLRAFLPATPGEYRQLSEQNSAPEAIKVLL